MHALIEQFIDAMRYDRGASAHTCRAYRTDLEDLAAFLIKAGRPAWPETTREHLFAYLDHLLERGFAASSRARRIASFRGFFGWLLTENRIAANPAARIPVIRRERRLPAVIAENAIGALLGEIGGCSYEDLRDRAILELLYATGIRVSELTGLNVPDVNFDRALIRVMGKGSKERLVPFGAAAEASLRRWIEHRCALAERAAPRQPAPLFINRRGQRITRSTVAVIVRERVSRRLPPGRHASPHTLRHTFATHLLAHEAPIRDIQELLGHASLATTQLYTHLDPTRLGGVHRQFHPRA